MKKRIVIIVGIVVVLVVGAVVYFNRDKATSNTFYDQLIDATNIEVYQQHKDITDTFVKEMKSRIVDHDYGYINDYLEDNLVSIAYTLENKDKDNIKATRYYKGVCQDSTGDETLSYEFNVECQATVVDGVIEKVANPKINLDYLGAEGFLEDSLYLSDQSISTDNEDKGYCTWSFNIKGQAKGVEYTFASISDSLKLTV